MTSGKRRDEPVLDLDPHEWRLKGRKPIKHFKPQPKIPLGKPLYYRPVFTFIGILCGIWAGTVISICKYWLPGQSALPIAALAFGPGLLFLGVLVLFDD